MYGIKRTTIKRLLTKLGNNEHCNINAITNIVTTTTTTEIN